MGVHPLNGMIPGFVFLPYNNSLSCISRCTHHIEEDIGRSGCAFGFAREKTVHIFDVTLAISITP